VIEYSLDTNAASRCWMARHDAADDGDRDPGEGSVLCMSSVVLLGCGSAAKRATGARRYSHQAFLSGPVRAVVRQPMPAAGEVRAPATRRHADRRLRHMIAVGAARPAVITADGRLRPWTT
jgi:hypothetical protein